MVRGDIVGGIKIALSKGKNLQEIIQSFYNAGYQKQDIDEAVNQIKSENYQPQVIKTIPEKKFTPTNKIPEKKQISKPQVFYQPPPQKKPFQFFQKKQKTNFVTQKSFEQPIKKEFEKSQFIPIQPPPSAQMVSSYGQSSKKIDFVTILLVVILVVLVGVLISVFFFKQEIVEFLNKILE